MITPISGMFLMQIKTDSMGRPKYKYIGRPIRDAKDPKAAAVLIADEIAAVLTRISHEEFI